MTEYRCIVCGWEGKEGQQEFLPSKDAVCPVCGSDELESVKMEVVGSEIILTARGSKW